MARPSFFGVLYAFDKVKLRGYNFETRNSVQYDTTRTCKSLNKKKVNIEIMWKKNRWSSDMKEIWNVKIVFRTMITNGRNKEWLIILFVFLIDT